MKVVSDDGQGGRRALSHSLSLSLSAPASFDPDFRDPDSAPRDRLDRPFLSELNLAVDESRFCGFV